MPTHHDLTPTRSKLQRGFEEFYVDKPQRAEPMLTSVGGYLLMHSLCSADSPVRWNVDAIQNRSLLTACSSQTGHQLPLMGYSSRRRLNKAFALILIKLRDLETRVVPRFDTLQSPIHRIVMSRADWHSHDADSVRSAKASDGRRSILDNSFGRELRQMYSFRILKLLIVSDSTRYRRRNPSSPNHCHTDT